MTTEPVGTEPVGTEPVDTGPAVTHPPLTTPAATPTDTPRAATFSGTLDAGIDWQTCRIRDVGEALERLTGGRYALCLVDMRLPDGSGIDVLHARIACQIASMPS